MLTSPSHFSAVSIAISTSEVSRVSSVVSRRGEDPNQSLLTPDPPVRLSRFRAEFFNTEKASSVLLMNKIDL